MSTGESTRQPPVASTATIAMSSSLLSLSFCQSVWPTPVDLHLVGLIAINGLARRFVVFACIFGE